MTGLTGAKLDSGPKDDPRKALIALAVKREAGVPLKWIAGRLKMGVTINISRYANEALSETRVDPRKAKMLRTILE